jgi:hypothetical protein
MQKKGLNSHEAAAVLHPPLQDDLEPLRHDFLLSSDISNS